MKKLLFCLAALAAFTGSALAQPAQDPSQYLAHNDDFVSFVNTLMVNDLKIASEMNNQLGEQLPAFRETLSATASQEEFDAVIARFGLDRTVIDESMAESLAYGMILKQKDGWLWDLSPSRLQEVMVSAIIKGLNTSDPRWDKIRSLVIGGGSGTQAKVSIYSVANCIWDSIKETLNIVGNAAAVLAAANQGNMTVLMAELKILLKKGGKKLGWFGLALTAIDIAMCILND